jgi:hypothetical protein
VNRFRAFLITISVAALLATAPSSNAAGLLVGQITGDDMSNKRIPLGWARVAAYANGTLIQSVAPGFDGSYSMYLPSGLCVVTVEHPGYDTQSKIVKISDRRATRLDFYLGRAPIIAGNAFDFSLSSDRPIMVLAGELSWTTLQVTHRAGSSQNVSLSISGLPRDAFASFSPLTANPSFVSICIITASAGTPLGSYTVTVTGISDGVTRSTSFTLTISPHAYSPDLF